MAINGMALGALGIGAVVLYSGVTGKSPLAITQNIITGKSPSAVLPTQQIVSNSASAYANQSSQPTSDPGGLAGIAIQDVGHAYQYGGAPGINGTNPWDCSSACNWWAGKKAGLVIPYDNPYTGIDHGPATGSWFFFGSMYNGSRTAPDAGIIIVWTSHMGISLGNGNICSALNPGLGTRVTSIVEAAPFGEPMNLRQI